VYLTARGLTPEDINAYELGYVPEKHAIYIPYFTKNVEIGGRIRFINPAKMKYLPLNNFKEHLWRVDATGDEHVFLTEGEFDAMILTSLGYSAVGVPGATSFKREWRFLFRDCDRVTICFDADEAGEKGGNRVMAWIGDVCDDVRRLELPPGMDVTEAALAGKLEGVLKVA
jgi:DNA primase